MDGIDVALLSTDGDQTVSRGPSSFHSYRPEVRKLIEQGLQDALAIKSADERPGSLRQLEQLLTEEHADAVQAFLKQCKMRMRHVDVIGMHGQTVLHRPDQRLTVQLGDGPTLAKMLEKTVVYDFRSQDVAAGGQGAPFVPIYHQALASKIAERPLAVVNIGGVANVTYIGRSGELIAFDTGPGNALMDDWTKRHTGQFMDRGGALAAKGNVNDQACAQLMSHGYFTAAPPKSLDRNEFSMDAISHLSAQDGAGTLAAFTAQSVAIAADHFPEVPEFWIICGGGRLNPVLMAELENAIAGKVVSAEVAGFDGDSMEAEAFAYLAVRSERGLPISFPATTGCPEPTTGGRLARIES